MTDIGTFIVMLTIAGVPHEVETHDGSYERKLVVRNWQHESRTYETHGCEGYSGFYSVWTFDRNGKLVSVAHWE